MPFGRILGDTGRFWRLLLLFAVMLTAAGCGGGGGSSSVIAVGGSQPAPEPVASVVLEFNLEARDVPADVTAFRIFGFAADGQQIYGPVVRNKAARIVLNDVPVRVTSLRIEYLEGERVAGIAVEEVVLNPGGQVIIEDPPFVDVPIILTRIEVTPATPSLPVGTTVHLTATGFFDDGTRQDLTSQATWSAGTPSIASVGDDGRSKGLVSGLSPGSTAITADYSGVSGSTSVTVTPAALVSLEIAPPTSNVPLGLDQQLTATGTYTDGSKADLTTAVVWASQDESRVRVSNTAGSQGRAYSISLGAATVTATQGTVTTSATVTVTDALLNAVQVTPATATLPMGVEQAFTATGVYTDGTTRNITEDVDWGSSQIAVASVSNTVGTRGLATPHTPGDTTITATHAGTGLSGSAALQVVEARLVSLQVEPATVSLAAGLGQALTATGTFTDGSTRDMTAEVAWSSSDTGVATISSTGDLLTRTPGQATITATSGTVTDTCQVTVTSARLQSLQVDPPAPSVPLGVPQQFTATGTFSDGTTGNVTTSVTWTSSDTLIATLGNSPGFEGVATPVAPGQVTVTATDATTGVTATATLTVRAAELVSIEVAPATASIAKGLAQQFTATGTYTDGSKQDLTAQVGWLSANPAVAQVDNATTPGLATGLGVGETDVTASMPGTSVLGKATLTVTAARLVGLGVTPATASIAKGLTQQFTATGTYTDGTTADLTGSVSWTTDSATVATISNVAGSQGLATGIGTGQAGVTATDVATGFSGTAALTVTAAQLVSVSVDPATASKAKGLTQQFTATGTYTDGSTQDLTSGVTWSSSAAGVASVSNVAGSQGLATAVGVGDATLTALHVASGHSDTATFTVTEATLVSLQVDPPAPSVAAGYTQQFTATGTYTDGTTQDLTSLVTWSSSDTAVATVSNSTGAAGLASALASGQASIRATVAGGPSASAILTVTAATLQTLSVSPGTASVPKGATSQFTATGQFSDGSTQDLTTQVAWSSSDTAIATLSNTVGTQGLATGLAVGQVTVTARHGATALESTATLDVTPARLVSISVSPGASSIPLGLDQQFTATGTYSDATTRNITTEVIWTSSDENVAFVHTAPGSEGLAESVGTGTTTLTVRDAATGVTGTANLRVNAAELVSIAVDPVAPQAPKGLAQQFTATGTYTDGGTQDVTTQATWASSDAAIASISNVVGSQGLATGLGVGETTITASLSGKSGNTLFTVTAAELVSIEVAPADQSVPVGMEVVYTATGVYTDGSTQDLTAQASWASGDANLVRMTGNVATGLAPGGPVAVVAGLGGKVGQANLTVTPAVLVSLVIDPTTASVPAGLGQRFTATGLFSDGSTSDVTEQVTWTSDNEAVATVDNAPGQSGLATGRAPGQVFIKATDNGNPSISVQATLTVTEAQLVSVGVTPATKTLPAGLEQQFTATGTYTDSTTRDLTAEVTWSSSDANVAAISNALGSHGLATALAAGPTTITALEPTSGRSGTASLTVTPAELLSIQVDPPTASIPVGRFQAFTATGTYTDGSTADLSTAVTWSSSNTGFATVSNAPGTQGLASGLAVGQVTITATEAGTGKAGTATLTVTAAELVSLAVDPTSAEIPDGATQQFTATGTFSDSTTRNLTTQVAWSTSNGAIATVSNTDPTRGLATGRDPGEVTVTATDTASGKTATATLTVGPARLASISVTPTDLQLAKGLTQQYTAMGTFTDGTVLDLTGLLTWSSTQSAVASVSTADGSRGLVTALQPGDTIIRATEPALSLSGETNLTVTPAELQSLVLSPLDPSIAKGNNQQFSVTGQYTDGSTADLTTQVGWSSSDAGVAPISNAPGSQGLATGLAAGETTITATHAATGKTASTLLTVTPAVLLSLQVDPPSATIPKATARAFTATGTYSDSTTSDLTGQVTWSTGDAAVATVSNADGTRGVATGVAAGETSVTATDAGTGKTASATLTVTDATLVSIEVTPTTESIAIGTTRGFTATGIYSDASTRDLTEEVGWTSSAPAVASISNTAGTRGVATGLTAGDTTLTATHAASGLSDTATLNVRPANLVRIQVDPGSGSVPKGLLQQFSATGYYEDSSTQDLTSQVSWTVSNPAVATISTEGLMTAVAEGQVEVTATHVASGLSDTAEYSVSQAVFTSIDVTPKNASTPARTTSQMLATATLSDNTTQDVTPLVTWTSSDEAIATISNVAGSQGRLTGVSAGVVTITATDPVSHLTGNTNFTVTAAPLTRIEITPDPASVPVNANRAFTCTGVYADDSTRDLTTEVTWESLNTAVATISNEVGTQGVARGISAGQATIRAQHVETGFSDEATLTVSGATLQSIQVNPPSTQVPINLKTKFTATGIYSDASTVDLTSEVTWSTSDETKATIDISGLATGKAVGNVTITATAYQVAPPISGTATLEVKEAALVSISLAPENETVATGTQQPYAAFGTYSDNTTRDISALVTWSTSDIALATISNDEATRGVASAVAPGTVEIRALEPTTGLVGTTNMTITGAALVRIEVTPPTKELPSGLTEQYQATGVYSDTTTRDLTATVLWASSNTAVATISNAEGSKGLATAAGALGTTTITATDPATGTFGEAVLTGTQAILTSMVIQPGSATVTADMTEAFAAEGTFSDGSLMDVTTQVTWTSDDEAVATISNEPGLQGVARGVSVGTTTIRAQQPGGTVAASASISVNDATIVSFEITPPTVEVPMGTEQQLQAVATMSDNSQRNLTMDCAWSSSDLAIATVTSDTLTRGRLFAKATGNATITANYNSGAWVATRDVTVTAAQFQRLAIVPDLPVVSPGRTFGARAEAIYTDQSRVDVTDQTTWASSDANILTVSNAAGTKGEVTTVADGVATLTATYNAAEATTQVGVRTMLYVTATNPGQGAMQAWRVVGSSGGLQKMAEEMLPPGCLPEELAVHPSGGYLYVPINLPAVPAVNNILNYAIGVADNLFHENVPGTGNTDQKPALAVAMKRDGTILYSAVDVLNTFMYVFPVREMGAVLQQATTVAFPDSGTPRLRMDPLDRFLLTTLDVVTGDDAAAMLRVNPDGSLTIPTQFRPANTPRDSAFSPNGAFVFTCEADGVSAWRVTATDPYLEPAYPAKVSTGDVPTGLAVSKTSEHLYVAAGTNVKMYDIDFTGALTLVADFPAGAAGCKDVVLVSTPDGPYLVALLNDGYMRVFTVNATTGALAPVGDPVATGYDVSGTVIPGQ